MPATYTGSTHSHFLPIPIARRKFHSDRFFLGTVPFWNKLPRTCFLGY